MYTTTHSQCNAPFVPARTEEAAAAFSDVSEVKSTNIYNIFTKNEKTYI